jgi:hypothetical protein
MVTMKYLASKPGCVAQSAAWVRCIIAMSDFEDGRFVPAAYRFNTLVAPDPAALAAHLSLEGFAAGTTTLGECAHRYHPERAVRVLSFASGVLVLYGDSWEELRPTIAALLRDGHARRAGEAWMHGGGDAILVSHPVRWMNAA